MRRARDGFEVVPLVSAGDNIPLLTSAWPDLQPHAALTYGIASDPDGMGLMTVGDYHYVWLQREPSATSPKTITLRPDSPTRSTARCRARLSLIKLTKDWLAIGGQVLLCKPKSA